MTDLEKLALAMYPDVDKTPEDYENLYPPRESGGAVTRFAPSPTGYMHLGNLFSASIDFLAAKDGGTFYLRLEDTDKKREVEGAVEKILDGLSSFGITPTEGVTGSGTETGDYGPYVQSMRKDIYSCYAKSLVEKGLAYPCFCTEEKLSAMREEQTAAGETPGYRGKWAVCRSLSPQEALARVEAGESYVVRLRSERSANKVTVDDCIKGRLELPSNDTDAVIMKADGIPPYAFAHAVDDHLMRTTHVIRGDEWIASLPLHMELHKALGFRAPKYAHIAPIMKTENGNKRKLSKRKDPEAGVSFYKEAGYTGDTVLEYLMTIANSNFEQWRKQNPDAVLTDFPFSLKKMSASGALFDFDKLEDVGKNRISRLDARTVYELLGAWAEEFDPDFYGILAKDPDYSVSVLSIDRGGNKPRKDMAKWSDAKDVLSFFYDGLFEPAAVLPDGVEGADAAKIIEEFLKTYDPADDKNVWFEKVKAICPAVGYCADMKEYKKSPGEYRGSVAMASAVLRLAATGRTQTPDLTAVMAVLGIDRVRSRLSAYAELVNAGREE
ncbi:MAG: glutamate--tRNA ligase [Clostridia bacterium]|nr:glutamate--tRNA ligase [Clostridia bacterium]